MVKLKRNIVIILILTFFIIMITSDVYATDSIIQGAKDFLNKGQGTTLNPEKIKKASDMVYNVLIAVGSAIVVVVGAVLGIQFVFGSVEEKAKIHEMLIPYVIGTIIIYGSFGIWRLAVIMLNGLG